MKMPNNWPAKLAAIAVTVSAIIAVLKFVLKMHLSTVVFLVIALIFLAITIIAFFVLFSKTLSLTLITSTIKKIVRDLLAPFIEKRYMSTLHTFAAVIVAIMVVLVFFTTKRLPTTGAIEKIARKMGNNIAAKNMASLSSSMDNIIHTIISYQKDPDATRNLIYEDALKQAAVKGYVFYIPQRDYYITALNKRNHERLLTEEERNRIENSLDEIFKRSNERDQISLMNMILSDIRVTEELWKPKERLADLSPLDLIGVVGGYIGEHILKY
jgi:uncharacterized membrane protein YgaE (UPF0421/DUF939 family)